MFTAAQLAAADDELSGDAIIRARLYSREAPDYRMHPRRYLDLDTKLTEASTEPDLAKPINAILGILDAIESQGIEKTVAIRGGQKALNYDRSRDRGALQNYLLHILFDLPGELGTSYLMPFSTTDNETNNPTF